ncbi:hydrogenase maturation protease [Rhodococcus sp. BE178]|uniref:hydrogenase maturation protease n=1 Tax=Rhodococcus sp. BE178 TaxID=2817737 RepID=UPI003D214500
MRAAVIGIGNEFRRDDGVGPAVVRALRGRLAAEIPVCIPADTVDLVTAWSGTDIAIVVDLLQCARPRPGRVRRVATDGFAGAGEVGGHRVDVAAALALSRVLGTAPRRLVTFTVEGTDVRSGVGLSTPVRRAVPRVAAAVAAELVSGSVPRPGPSRPTGRRVR